MSNFINTYAREAMPVMVKGEGTYLIDESGKKYLDFVSGIAVNALGYGNPLIEKAIETQGKKLLHCSNLYQNDEQNALAAKLVETSFADKVFFCNSGTEANEAAIKFARKKASTTQSSKVAVLSFYDGFHGRTYGSMTATAQKRFHEGFHPLPGGYYYAPLNDIEATKKVLASAEFAAIIVEPIQGEGGVNVTSTEFLAFLREYATEHKISLIFDEIQCGMGRTGSLWAYEKIGVTPDILTAAKPLGGGLPLGAVLVTEAISEAIQPSDHGTTFGGNPLACAIGNVVLGEVSKADFLQQVNEKGAYLTEKLNAVVAKSDKLTTVLGAGLLCGVRFAGEPGSIVADAMEKGLLLVKAGNNTVRFIPPLTVTKDEIDTAVTLFEELL